MFTETLMPYRATVEYGGTHRAAFIPGWEAGTLNALLATAATISARIEAVAPASLVGYLSAISSAHGYAWRVKDSCDDPEWVVVRFWPAGLDD